MKKLAAFVVVLGSLGLLACDKSGSTPATSSSSTPAATAPGSAAAPADSGHKAGSGW